MKNISIGKNLLAVAMSLAISNAAYSDTYVGGAFGQTGIDIDGYDNASSFKVFGGMRNNNLGFEAAYIDLGKFDITGSGGSSYAEVDGLEISAVGYLPVSNNIDLMAKVGLYAWNADVTLFNSPYGSEDGTDLTYGVGGQIKVSDNVALRGEYQIFTDVSGGDFDMLSAGVSFNF